jgi:ribonuclease P protein component
MSIQNNCSFKKNERIKRDKDFEYIFKNGELIKSHYYKCFYLKRCCFSRIGIIAKKHIGNSIRRNYEKRIIREFYRNYKNKLNNGYDFIFIITDKSADFKQKKEDFQNIMKLIIDNDKK